MKNGRSAGSIKKLSLRAKLSMAFLLFALVLFVLIGVFANFIMEKQFEAYTVRELEQTVRDKVGQVSARFKSAEDYNASAIEDIGVNALSEAVPIVDEYSFRDRELVLDNLRHEVLLNGEQVSLTPNEFRLLLTLAKYPTKTFTRDELIAMALGDDFDGYDRVIDTHIKNIRQKIEPDPKKPRYILTVHGVGYKFGGDAP